MFVVTLVITTLVFPGVGHVTMGRRWRGYALVLATSLALLGAIVTVWSLVAWLVLRIVATIDLIACKPRARSYVEGALAAAASATAMIAIRLVALAPFGVPSASMEPTVGERDSVLVDRLARHPARGDIVAFVHPCQRDRTYLKRVVALGGDRVELRCGVLQVNGAIVDRHATGEFPSLQLPFAPHCSNAPAQPIGALVAAPGAHAACDAQLHFVVPADSMFVLGDNREHSNDSREFGVVPVADVVGRAIGIYSPAHFGDLR